MGRRRNWAGFFDKLLLAAIIAGAGFLAWKKFVYFDADGIVQKSILAEKTINQDAVEIISESGIKAYLFEDKTNPIISVNFLFRNTGYAYDNKEGIANLAASMLLEGAGSYHSQKFKEELELRAIGISFGVDVDDFTGSLTYLKDEQETAAALMAAVLDSPIFAAADLARVKEQTLMALLRQQENPAAVLDLDFAREIYGAHPYARNELGNSDSVKSIERKDLQLYVRNRFAKDNLVVGIAGDISKDEAKAVLDKVFGGLTENATRRALPAAKLKFDGRIKDVKRNIAQAMSIFASQGISRNHPDFYSLYIANHIFGGAGLNARLSAEIREKEGMSYSIYTYLSMQDEADLIRGGFSSTEENMDFIIKNVKAQWKKMGENGVSEKELENAKKYLVSSYNLRYTSIAEIARMMTYMQRDNLGLDFLKNRNGYIEAVNLEDINRVIKVYFKNDNLVFVNIGRNN